MTYGHTHQLASYPASATQIFITYSMKNRGVRFHTVSDKNLRRRKAGTRLHISGKFGAGLIHRTYNNIQIMKCGGLIWKRVRFCFMLQECDTCI